jgi:hypothetical protein
MKLIPVHMAWNDEHGILDTLTSIEFTSDCEFCALETDPIDGDPVVISGNSFTIFESREHQNRNEGVTFQFQSIAEGVGNWCWDMIWMTPEECGRFMEHIQAAKHWTLTVADPEIMRHWKKLTGSGFVKYAMEIME